MKITDKLVLFFSNKDILSNFYPCTIMYNGLKFHCSEQLFMYLKAVYFNDEAMANNILNCKTPQEAKQYGRCVRGYDDNSWNKVRDEQMFIAVKAKYDSVFKFREFLNEHKDKKFAEASPYDKIWGLNQMTLLLLGLLQNLKQSIKEIYGIILQMHKLKDGLQLHGNYNQRQKHWQSKRKGYLLKHQQFLMI